MKLKAAIDLSKILFILMIGFFSFLSQAHAQESKSKKLEDFLDKVKPINAIRTQSQNVDQGCAISNYGLIGDPLGRFHSFEIPKGSGRNYISNIELWAGVQLTNGQILVTTADGEHNGREPEWNSADFDSIQYVTPTKGALADVDNYCRYDDINVIPIPGHGPIGLEVAQSVYSWMSEKFMIVEFDIRNLGIHGDLNN